MKINKCQSFQHIHPNHQNSQTSILFSLVNLINYLEEELTLLKKGKNDKFTHNTIPMVKKIDSPIILG